MNAPPIHALAPEVRWWLVAALAATAGTVALGIFGMPPVNLHSPLHDRGIMDPACGGTRATIALARGQFSTAWRYNPGVFALAAAVASILVRSLVGLKTGSWWRMPLPRRSWLISLAAGLLALEINQQAHAALLR